MPRYAKGSLEEALWDDIYAHQRAEKWGHETPVHDGKPPVHDGRIAEFYMVDGKPVRYGKLVPKVPKEPKEPRANGTGGRAHRHEWFMNRTPHDKVTAIKSFCRMHDSFWLSDDNLLMIVGNILNGR